MENLNSLIKKHKEFLLYIFFGILTTLVNILSYYLLYEILSLGNVLSTIVSWVISVVFAYLTNKLFVFESRVFKISTLLKEALAFFLARSFTGVLDVIIMYVSVDLLSLNSMICKLASNVIVVILNYIFSKLWIFKK